MNKELVATLTELCEREKLNYRVMHSGAGHDAQIFAPRVPTCMIFIPSINGISHNPAERTNITDITVDQAERLTTDKGEWLLYRAHVKGESTEALLPNMVATSLAKLPIPKLMRWGASDVHFVRPVHTVTLLLGDKVIPATILGIQSDRVIRGHRFMGEPEFTIDNADQYPEILRERGKVIADYEERKAKIKADAEEAARKIGGNADLSESLLEEVASLVEWPVVLTAKFEEKFLAVPAEALVYTMKGDQKYFPVYANDGKLLPNFIFVANIESKDPQQIISGNEKVVRPRLADAEFFFNTDRKKRLEDNLPRLQTVLFQQQLGTLRDKTDRIQALAGWIAEQIGADVNHATRAGLLSKCDLMTNMVFEFTDTQGVMGMHYARHIQRVFRTPRVAAPAIYVALSNAWTICINWALMPSG